jgi:spermidine synthase
MPKRRPNASREAVSADKDRSASDSSDVGGTAMIGVVTGFLLSGFAALLYQTAWLRQFSLVFGTSELAVATVLAAYMGGLALGAAVAGRFVDRISRPILIYAILEAGIALSALSVPLLLTGAGVLYATILGDYSSPPDAALIGQPIFYLIVAFLVLALPTGFMGATLPLLTRHVVRSDADVGPKVALLYAINTVGAVLGTVVAAFILLPTLGLSGTVWIGVAVNGLVFAIAAMLAKNISVTQVSAVSTDSGQAVGFIRSCISPLFDYGSDSRERLTRVFRSQPAWILPLMLASGAIAFTYEVLWSRMLAHVIGGSIYAFATMLAAFLTGIALGGGLIGKFAIQRDTAAFTFAVTQVAIAVLSIAVFSWMGPLIPSDLTTLRVVIYAMLVMLPATIFIGATFPLAVRVLVADERDAGVNTARIYSWNTLGAIVGAVAAGFYLIPGLGFEGTIKLAVLINLGLALWAASFTAQWKPAFASAIALGFLVTLFGYSPSRPQAVISNSGYLLAELTDTREIFYAVGRSATVMLEEHGGYYFVRTNGLPEASIAAKGAPPVKDPEKWLTALAVTARPETRNMLVIGFGGGVALEGVPASVEQVDVVELEPEVINANRALAGMRNVDPLVDPRLNVVINDARNALRLSSKRYDVIVSQPSHPWTAGASHLFTREFVAEAKNHLQSEGVFVQWMNSEFVDAPLLRTLAATLRAEFDYVRLYQPVQQMLMFHASDGALDTEISLAETGQPLATEIMHFSRLGILSVEDLIAALVMDEQGVDEFSRDAPISTDDNNLMATDSNSRGDGLVNTDLNTLLEPYDPLTRQESWIRSDLGNALDYGYLTRRLINLAQHDRAAELAQLLAGSSTSFEIYGLLYEASNEPERARTAFESAIAADPSNSQARFHLIKDQLELIGRGESRDDVESLTADLAASAAAVVEGWSYGATGDWAALARLDAELAASQITDAWYPEAARLRAEWRTYVTQEPERFANEALRLIDIAAVLAPERNLFLLRAANAITLSDDDILLESSRQIGLYLRATLDAAEANDLPIEASELAQMSQNVTAIQVALQGNADYADPERLDVITIDLAQIARSIDEFASL